MNILKQSIFLLIPFLGILFLFLFRLFNFVEIKIITTTPNQKIPEFSDLSSNLRVRSTFDVPISTGKNNSSSSSVYDLTGHSKNEQGKPDILRVKLISSTKLICSNNILLLKLSFVVSSMFTSRIDCGPQELTEVH